MKIFVLSTEKSGDVLASDLIAQLKKKYKKVEIIGVGSELSCAAGLKSLFDPNDIAVMGVAEVLPKIALLRARIKQCIAAIECEQPDLVITVDAPDFNFRVIKGLKNFNGKSIHYVAPSVWAWRPKRANKIAQLYDGLLCLLPFEPPYFEKEGLASCFVGHPAARKFKPKPFKKQIKTIGILPGSRVGEIKRMGPDLARSIKKIALAYPDIAFVLPTFPQLKNTVSEIFGTIPNLTITTDQKDKFKVMDYALATSGTVGLELACAGVPHCIAYKMHKVTHFILDKMVLTRFGHILNNMQGTEIVKEFIQDDCRPADIARYIAGMIDDGSERKKQHALFKKLQPQLLVDSNVAGGFIGKVVLDKKPSKISARSK